MDAETCPSPAASAADSGTVVGIFLTTFSTILTNLLAGLFFFVALASWVMKLADGGEVLKMRDYRICGFRPALHSDSCYRQNLLFR